MTRTLTVAVFLLLVPSAAWGSTGGSPPLPEDSTKLDDMNVPLDGVVAGQSECGPCDVAEVRITTADGTPVEGVVTDLSDFRRVGAWAFTPSSPWEPGEYLAYYAEGDPVPFTVLDEVVTPPAVQPNLSGPIGHSGDPVECVTKAPSAESPEGEWDAFYLTGSKHGFFSVDTVGSSKAQYTYLTGVEGEIRFEPYGTGHLFEVMPGNTEICYWVRAQRLVSREETLLVSECYSPDELLDYVWDEPDAEEFQAFLRDRCIRPPLGRAVEWCSLFQSALAEGECGEFENVEACESALSICSGVPTAVGAGGSNGVGAGGSNSVGAGGSKSVGAGGSKCDSAGPAGGCSVLALPGSSPLQGGGAGLVILASLAALLRRRSREAQHG
jgi:hypothetical protein